jgi:hypothetical protein
MARNPASGLAGMMGPGPSCPQYTVGLVPVSLNKVDLVSVSRTHRTTTRRLGVPPYVVAQKGAVARRESALALAPDHRVRIS